MTTPTLRGLIETYIASPEALAATLKGEPLLQYKNLHFHCSKRRMLALAKVLFPNRRIKCTKRWCGKGGYRWPDEGDYTITIGDTTVTYILVWDGTVSTVQVEYTL